MIVIIRFHAPGSSFQEDAERAIAWWSQCVGCTGLELVRNIDEPDLWAIVGDWESVGDYRRSFSGYEAKLMLTPLLLLAVDEPSAYLPPGEVGLNLARIN